MRLLGRKLLLYQKDSTGACILIELAYNQKAVAAGHVIRNNFFYDFPNKDGRSNANDSEVIRIGLSDRQGWNASCLVQGNYFLETDGENEIISNKSANNRYINNTFRKCRGALVLRHGASAWVEGNFFFYMNTAKSSRGPTHSTMANNLVHSTRGTLITGALSIAGIDFDDNNILSGSAIGQTISAITTDPVMTLGGDAVYSPSETGSAANAAEGSYVPVEIFPRLYPDSKK